MKVNPFRYQKENLITTRLDVLEDTMNYLSFFKSLDFTDDILYRVHNITDSRERKILATYIKEHVWLSIDLANQAFNSKEELSYLPLYYSCLNLIKAHLLFMNKRSELNRNLKHGMSYREKWMKRDFFNEEISFFKCGAVPLYYRTISGNTITNKEEIKISIKDIYSKIRNLTAEYSMVSIDYPVILELKSWMTHINGQNFMSFYNHSSYYKDLPNTRMVQSIQNVSLSKDKKYYLSKNIISNQNDIDRFIESNINKYYINNFYCDVCKEYHLYTSVSWKKHVFNEDLSVILAYFHLSNVIRYNPMHYKKIINSKYNPLITALRKHGYFTFIKSMIGHFHKSLFDVNIKTWN